MKALAYFWRHPRRTGFIVFNIIAVGLLILWGRATAQYATDGLAGVPNVMLGYTGMGLLLVALLVGWIGWGTMVYQRHHRQTLQAPSP